MRHGVQVLDLRLSLIGEALHLHEIYWEKTNFVPDVQHDINLKGDFKRSQKRQIDIRN